MVRTFELSPAVFPLVYQLGLHIVTLTDTEQAGFQADVQQLIHFTEQGTGRNFLAYIEGRTFLPNGAGDGFWLLHVGRVLRDVTLHDEATHGPATEAVAYYKHLNGVGRWVKLAAPGELPAMHTLANEGVPDGNLLLAQAGQEVLLYNYGDREGGWRFEHALSHTPAIPRYNVEWNPGQYMNLYAPQ